MGPGKTNLTEATNRWAAAYGRRVLLSQPVPRLDLSPGNYTIYVALQEGSTQTAPLFVPPPPETPLADCTSYTASNIRFTGGNPFSEVGTWILP